MFEYPLDGPGRAALRAASLARLIARAEATAAQARRSITCARHVDHSTCAGAARCLCECHDPSGGTDG